MRHGGAELAGATGDVAPEVLVEVLVYALQKYRASIDCITNFFKKKNGICSADLPRKGYLYMHDSNILRVRYWCTGYRRG